jgi:hypothetical protein
MENSRSRKGDKALRQSAAALQEAEEYLRACIRQESVLRSQLKKDPTNKKWNTLAYANASIARRFAELRLSEVKASRVEGGKAFNVEVIEALRDTQEKCFRAQKKGAAAPLLLGFDHFGPELFITEGEVNQLFWWWLDLFRVGVQGDQPALRLYKQVCDALGKGSQGAVKQRDSEEQRQERGDRDRRRIENTRRLQRVEKAVREYEQRTKGETDPATIRRIAFTISDSRFSRQSPAVQQANESYWRKVNQDPRLKKPVARKTRGFSG